MGPPAAEIGCSCLNLSLLPEDLLHPPPECRTRRWWLIILDQRFDYMSLARNRSDDDAIRQGLQDRASSDAIALAVLLRHLHASRRIEHGGLDELMLGFRRRRRPIGGLIPRRSPECLTARLSVADRHDARNMMSDL